MINHLKFVNIDNIFKLIPKSLIVKIGNTKIGASIINLVKEIDEKKICEIENSVKIYVQNNSKVKFDSLQKNDKEKKVKKIFLDLIKPNDVVIDCGTWIGEYTLIACSKVGKEGKVFAIEPSIKAIKKLESNLKLNGFVNCKIINEAISDKVGKADFYENPIGITGTLDGESDNRFSKKTIVKINTIDEIVKREKIKEINMIKIDVEGFEGEVLRGSKKSLQEGIIKNILCEVHVDHLKRRGILPESITNQLKYFGYDVIKLETDSDKREPHILATKN